MAPQRDEHLQPQTSEPLQPGALGQRPENLGRQVLVPAPHAREFGGGATAKKRRKHHAEDFPEQPLLASQAAFDLLDEIVRQADVVQGLFEGLDGTLCLGTVTLEAFRDGAATALSGFGLALLIGCGAHHSVLLHMGVTTLKKERRPGPRSRAWPSWHVLGAARPSRWPLGERYGHVRGLVLSS
jgi:hypothetical protein